MKPVVMRDVLAEMCIVALIFACVAEAFVPLLSNTNTKTSFTFHYNNHHQTQQARFPSHLFAASLENDITTLLETNRARIDSLAADSGNVPPLTLLRFVLAFATETESRAALRETIAWRTGSGRPIVRAAREAVKQATVNGGWENGIVRDSAPHAEIINQYITPQNILTMSTEEGDLVYIIRASLIDDTKLMSQISVQQLVDFFLYVKEVHSIIIDQRAERTGKLHRVIFANDISGVSAIPDAKFSEALTASSQQYEKLYPAIAGPTMILNLPLVLQAFIGLIRPLFPKSVQERLLFETAPVLAGLKELTPLSVRDGKERGLFLDEIKNLLT